MATRAVTACGCFQSAGATPARVAAPACGPVSPQHHHAQTMQARQPLGELPAELFCGGPDPSRIPGLVIEQVSVTERISGLVIEQVSVTERCRDWSSNR